MHRKRKNISQCKAEAPDNKKRWCKPCQYKRGANQCEGPVPETTPTPALNPQRSSTVPFPKICGGCGVICCGVPMCFDCMRKGPTIPEPTIPEPTAVVPTCPAPTTPVLTSSSGRTITSPVPFQFSEKQIRDHRFSMNIAVRRRTIDETSRSVSPAPSSLQSPLPTPPSARPPTITINEAFELQRLQAEFTKAADNADVLSFLNVKVLAVLRSMREEQTARKQAEAKCGALERQLHRVRASIAGQAVSSSRGAVPLPSGAPEGHGFQSQRSLRRHVKDCEDWLQEKYPNDELKQAQVARGLAGKLYADRDLSEHHKTTATKDAIIRGLCAFYSTLRAKWHTKLPNDAMAAQHAVDQAVMADAFGVSMASIADVLGTDEKRLAREFRSWHSWIDGEEPFKLAVRGKIRSDKLPTEVADYITNEAWLHDSVTRPSESKLGGLLDPANRTVKARHRIHWLETKLDAAYATIRDLTRHGTNMKVLMFRLGWVGAVIIGSGSRPGTN